MNDSQFNPKESVFNSKQAEKDHDEQKSALPETVPTKNNTFSSVKDNTFTAFFDNEDVIDRKQKKRNANISLIKLVIIAASIIMVIFISTFSWFSMNRNVATSGMNIKTATLPFDIATSGTVVRNESILELERSGVYSDGSSQSLYNESSVLGDYRVADSLKLRYTPVADDPATVNVNEDNTSDIGPGSHGKLNLFVIPKTDASIDVKVTLNVTSFAAIEEKDTNGNTLMQNGAPKLKIIEIKDAADFAAQANAVNNSAEAAKANDYVNAAKYLRGHIMFFGAAESNPQTSGYYFSTPYITREIDKTIPSGNNGTAVQVPIYWMWTNTLGQIALPNNVSNQRNGLPIISDTTPDEKAEITTYLIDNGADIFSNYNADTTPGYIDTVTTAWNASNFNNSEFKATFDAAFSNLSQGYNASDNAIGKMVAYFLIEVTVE